VSFCAHLLSQLALSALIALFAGKAALELLAAVGYGVVGAEREAISAWLYFFPNAAFAVALRAFERRTTRALLLYGALQVACCAARETALYRSTDHILLDVLASLSFSALLIAAVVLTGRALAVRRALALVAGDRRQYDAMWARLAADPAFATALGALQAELALLHREAPKAEGAAACRQLLRRAQPALTPAASRDAASRLARTLSRKLSLGQPPAGGKLQLRVGLEASGRPGTLNPGRPLKSFDQLFIQASGLHHILLAKAQARPPPAP
jgi:hypothetical protein